MYAYLLILQEAAIVGAGKMQLEVLERLALAEVVVILHRQDARPPP